MNTSTPHAFALFSGGLDSILAARLIMEQGLVVRCLHFVTPFFGKPQLIPHWEKVYGLEVEAVDVGEAFVRLLRERPAHGFGKVMNPCVDCKILMMRKARELMKKWGASFLISGEVLGQRPMSQRRDTLNVIRRDAEVKESLLRPLSAQLLDPTAPEISGLVDRNKLLGIFGRGRKSQMALADQMGLKEIPTPAGGCKLAEKENSRRYWPVLTRLKEPTVEDFELSNIGRQYWFGETIKSYLASPELSLSDLQAIPAVFAGWLRYLMGVDDNGDAFELSPDPLLATVRPYVQDLKLGAPADRKALSKTLAPLLSDASIFGVDLISAGLSDRVLNAFVSMLQGPGAVADTLAALTAQF